MATLSRLLFFLFKLSAFATANMYGVQPVPSKILQKHKCSNISEIYYQIEKYHFIKVLYPNLTPKSNGASFLTSTVVWISFLRKSKTSSFPYKEAVAINDGQCVLHSDILNTWVSINKLLKSFIFVLFSNHFRNVYLLNNMS